MMKEEGIDGWVELEMTAPLIQLTKEAHDQLVKNDRIRQVSEPLLIGSCNKFPDRSMSESIERMALFYRGANAYMMGTPLHVEGAYLTPFVLYEISTEKQSGREGNTTSSRIGN